MSCMGNRDAMAARVTEKQLLEARAERKEVDEEFQTMRNRISFLKLEEAKLDREIEKTRKRTEGLLNMKAERTKDDDVRQATKDVLSVILQTSDKAPTTSVRPGTGRSSVPGAKHSQSKDQTAGTKPKPLPASTNEPASTGKPSQPRTASAQRLQAPPSAPPPSIIPAPAPRVTRSTSDKQVAESQRQVHRVRSARSSSSNTTTNTTTPASQPALTPPLPPTVAPRSPAVSRPSSRQKAGTDSSKSPPASRPHSGIRANTQLPAQAAVGLAGEAFVGSGASSGREAGTTSSGGPNRMAMLEKAKAAAGGADDEVLEEILVSSSNSAAGAPKMEGLQQFVTQEVTKVVQVKSLASTVPKQSAGSSAQVVVAAGVGWGVKPTAPVGAAPTAPPGAVVVPVAEMAKKTSIWKVRKAFGLPATEMLDGSAHVEEVGAGAWQ